jgi:hypothetical protein
MRVAVIRRIEISYASSDSESSRARARDGRDQSIERGQTATPSRIRHYSLFHGLVTAIKDLKTKTAQNTCDNSRIVVLITFFTSESQGILFYKRSLQQAPLLLYYQSSDILLAQWYPSSRSKVNRPVEQDGRGRQDGVSAFATKQKRLCLAHGDQARMRRIQGYRDKGKTMIQTTR